MKRSSRSSDRPICFLKLLLQVFCDTRNKSRLSINKAERTAHILSSNILLLTNGDYVLPALQQCFAQRLISASEWSLETVEPGHREILNDAVLVFFFPSFSTTLSGLHRWTVNCAGSSWCWLSRSWIMETRYKVGEKRTNTGKKKNRTYLPSITEPALLFCFCFFLSVKALLQTWLREARDKSQDFTQQR